jgi:hypothetical protein
MANVLTLHDRRKDKNKREEIFFMIRGYLKLFKCILKGLAPRALGRGPRAGGWARLTG